LRKNFFSPSNKNFARTLICGSASAATFGATANPEDGCEEEEAGAVWDSLTEELCES
jgi:hypothetical protein